MRNNVRRSTRSPSGSAMTVFLALLVAVPVTAAWAQDSDGNGLPNYAQTATGVPVGWGYYFWD